MLTFVPDAKVPGFRVGLPDDLPGFSIDENGSVRRPMPPPSSAVPFGYDPYSDVLQIAAPTVVRPAGRFHQSGSGAYPTQYAGYVPVSGDLPLQAPPCDKRWTEPKSQWLEVCPTIRCGKRWTERPTLTPLAEEIRFTPSCRPTLVGRMSAPSWVVRSELALAR